ncbi:Leucine-rich repeat neuronal protein 3 [Aphelenchoides bicaudatus]|nr:Leucine-rich repeat neuronal protein 3 [Aphelenchoides bicaudatus]
MHCFHCLFIPTLLFLNCIFSIGLSELPQDGTLKLADAHCTGCGDRWYRLECQISSWNEGEYILRSDCPTPKSITIWNGPSFKHFDAKFFLTPEQRKHIKDIHIFDREIESISEDFLVEFPALVHLAFWFLKTNCRKLNLKNNNLPPLSSGTFENAKHLRELNLDWNADFGRDWKEYGFSENLETFDLNLCNISTFVTPSILRMKNLTRLSLSQNKMTAEEIGKLGKLPKLERLDVSGNYAVTKLDERWLESDTLAVLHLNRFYELTEIGDCAFCGLPNLTSLILNGSPKLERIHPNAFGADDVIDLNLVEILMSECNLKIIPEELLELNDLKKLDFANNPLKCDKRNEWMINDPRASVIHNYGFSKERFANSCSNFSLWRYTEMSEESKTDFDFMTSFLAKINSEHKPAIIKSHPAMTSSEEAEESEEEDRNLNRNPPDSKIDRDDSYKVANGTCHCNQLSKKFTNLHCKFWEWNESEHFFYDDCPAPTAVTIWSEPHWEDLTKEEVLFDPARFLTPEQKKHVMSLTLQGKGGCSNKLFHPRNKLESLQISATDLPPLATNTFIDAKHLKSLVINEQGFAKNWKEYGFPESLESIDMSFAKVSKFVTPGVLKLKNLKQLKLIENSLSIEEIGQLGQLPNLTLLNVGTNELITKLPTRWLSSTSLTELYLDGFENLEEIEDCAFCGLPNLKLLSLSRSSNLDKIHPNAFGAVDGTPNPLTKFHLTSKKLTIVPKSLLNFKNIHRLILRVPFECDYENNWISEKWVPKHDVTHFSDDQFFVGCVGSLEWKYSWYKWMIRIFVFVSLTGFLLSSLVVGKNCARSLSSSPKRLQFRSNRALRKQSKRDNDYNLQFSRRDKSIIETIIYFKDALNCKNALSYLLTSSLYICLINYLS